MLKKNKFSLVAVLSIVSLIFSLVTVAMLWFHNSNHQETTNSVLFYGFNYLAIAATIVFGLILILMLVKFKKFKWYDYLSVVLLIVLWGAAAIYYSNLCTALKFPEDTITMSGFYGVFFKAELVRVYMTDPQTSILTYVNFDLIGSVIAVIVSSVLSALCIKRNKQVA